MRTLASTWCLLLVLIVARVSAAASSPETLLDSARTTLFWSEVRGAEFPGATVQIDTVEDPQQGRVVRARCQFSGESRYAGFEWRGTLPKVQGIGFWCRLSDQDRGAIRIMDSTGQWLSANFVAKRAQWAKVEVAVDASTFSHHWAGANDGQIHFPITKVLIAVNRKPDAQEILVSRLFATGPLEGPSPWQVVIEPGVSMGVALKGEEIKYRVHAINRRNEPARARLRLTSQSLDGSSKEVGAWDLAAKGWEHITREVKLSAAELGFWKIDAELKPAGDASPIAATSALAVVPRPRNHGQWAPAAYFGIQSAPNLEVAERMGAKAYRQFVFWRFSEGTQGKIRFAEWFFDGIVAETKKHHMQLMFTVVLMPPKWAAWDLPGNLKAAELPDPARVQDYAKFVGAIAARYRDQEHVTTIEIENEPDLTCMKNVGFSPEQGADYFAPFLKAASAAAKQGNPKIQVASLCLSDYDYAHEFKFCKAVLDRAAASIDLFTGHPYASPREFGPGKRPKFPIQNQMAEKERTALDLMAAHGRPRRAWVGELGWPLRSDLDPLSAISLDRAGCIAQSLIVGKSVPGVERYLHFTLNGCLEKGFDYGLTRGDPAYSLPPVLTYAAAAEALEDAQPIELARVGEVAWRASFADAARDQLIIAWWCDADAARLHVPAGFGGKWHNSFFQPIQPAASVTLSRVPVFSTLPLKPGDPKPPLLDKFSAQAIGTAQSHPK